jgi:hypothetical protein
MTTPSFAEADGCWYTQVPSLKRSLTLLAKMPDDLQEVIGRQLIGYAKELAYTHKTLDTDDAKQDASTEGLNKLKRLMFNKTHHHPLVGRGLNEVMTLSEMGQQLVGTRLLLCLQAIDNLTQSQGGYLAEDRESRVMVHALIKSVFTEEMAQFEAQGREKKLEKIERQQEALQAQEALELATLELETLDNLDDATMADVMAATDITIAPHADDSVQSTGFSSPFELVFEYESHGLLVRLKPKRYQLALIVE